MSYPDPPNQPPWGAPGQPGSQYQPPHASMGYAQAPGRQPRASRVWMVPVAAGLGVVLMAGTVWAANSVAQNVFVGSHPESVLPGSSIAFASVDMRPSGGELADYAQFADRLPDSLRDEIDPDADPAEEVVESFLDSSDLEDMTYEDDFESWVGQRFGVSMWEPDDEEAAADASGSAIAIAVETEDDDAAEEALGQVQGEVDDLVFDVRDDFAILAPSSDVLSDLETQVESSGTLEEQDTYAEDMEAIGTDNLASAWMDLGRIAELSAENSEGDEGLGEYDEYDEYDEYGGAGPSDPLESLDYEDVNGRMAAGLQIEPEYVQLRGDTFDLSANGISTADYEAPEPGLDLMGDLPDDTAIAMGGSGMADMAGQAYEDDPDQFADLEGAMSELGLSMPEGLDSLLGENTALGLTDLEGSLDQFSGAASGPPSLQYRADGADSAALEEAIDQMWSGSYSSPPGVSTEGPVAVATSGTTGTERLGDDPVFKQTMADTEAAHMGLYMDLRPVAESAEESAPEQWGAMGASVTYDAETVSMRARWAPNGGE